MTQQPKRSPEAELLEAARNYLVALDQWENTDSADKRVKRAESVLRVAVKAYSVEAA